VHGLGIVLAGALAGLLAPSTSVVVCGAAGMVCAMLVSRVWRHAR
jgi:hypothetical protein